MYDALAAVFHLFPCAVVAGLLIAAACSALGVFVILKRVVFIGITLSEVAVCGVAGALALQLPGYLGAVVLTLLAAAVLAVNFEGSRLPRDAVLGVIFTAAGSGSILLVSTSGFGLHEIKALLYGDLILTGPRDLIILGVILVPVLVCLLLFLRPVLYTFLDRDAAKVMGLRVRLWELGYFLGLGLAVGVATKVAGAMLVFTYLAVAPAAGLLLCRRLWPVLICAIGIAMICTLAGLVASCRFDLPANQSIALLTGICFLLGAAWRLVAAR